MNKNKNWEFKVHSYQIADTGDYSDVEIEFTNGKISLFTNDEIEDCECNYVVEKLNEIKEVNFHLDDTLSFENHILEQQIKQLKLEVESYRTLIRNDEYNSIDYEKLFWDIFEDDFDEEHKLYNELRSFSEEYHSLKSELYYDEGESDFIGNNKIVITFSETGGQNESDPDGWLRVFEITFDYQKAQITDFNYIQG